MLDPADEPSGFRALLVDLDGTLLDPDSRMRPRVRESLRAAAERGAKIVICTGRSVEGTLPTLEELGLDHPAVVYNGAAYYCPRAGRLLEERVLSNTVRQRIVQFAEQEDMPVVLMSAGKKIARAPRDEDEREALRGLENLELVGPGIPIECDFAIRATAYSVRHGSSADLARRVSEFLDAPIYITEFPLNSLPNHRGSRMQVVDVHPPCRGKAEGLRIIEDLFGIPAEQVIAVGDASNDTPMIRAAGLGVAMENSMPCLLVEADRVIGPNEGDSLAELCDELL